MLDSQSGPLDIAAEVGFRIVQTGPDAYQFQRVNARGVTVAVAPTQQHTYELWLLFVSTAQRLGAALEGGEGGEPKSQSAPRVA